MLLFLFVALCLKTHFEPILCWFFAECKNKQKNYNKQNKTKRTNIPKRYQGKKKKKIHFENHHGVMLIDNEEIPVSVSMAVARWIKKKNIKKTYCLQGRIQHQGFLFFSIVFKTKNQKGILTGNAAANESTLCQNV